MLLESRYFRDSTQRPSSDIGTLVPEVFLDFDLSSQAEKKIKKNLRDQGTDVGLSLNFFFVNKPPIAIV